MAHHGNAGLGSGHDHLEPVDLSPITLRFRDPGLEAAFRRHFFRDNLGNIRFAFLGGAVLFVLWGLVLYPHLLALADKRVDLILRYGVFIPVLILGFALSFTRFFERIWEWVTTGVAILTILIWVYYISLVLTMPAEYGWAGLILITAFTYTLLRLRFVLVMLVTVVGIAAYMPYAVDAVYIFGVTTVLAALFLVTFGVLGGVVAYRTERSIRLLFVRERQLDVERHRSDSLLLNVLPQEIVERLKSEPEGAHVAEALDEVSVVFADAVDSTREAVTAGPEEFADVLDELFSAFDRLADRHGLEKIKTVGDAYMAVAGAPVSMRDNAGAGANMALEMLEAAHALRWPSGNSVELHIGVATGPAVAGVIGQRKFAYDLWGDTVNLASRLQESAEPGQILLSWATAERLEGRYELAMGDVVEIKGRGTTPVRSLLARRSNLTAPRS